MIETIETLAKSQLLTLNGETVVCGVTGDNTDGTPVHTLHHLANQVIDQKYKIISLLGEGGMGTVYKAHHLLLDKDVALKTFRAPNLTDDSWKRFQREAQAIARLSHINIVQVFDFGVGEGNIPYYTMECLSGESLEDRLAAAGPLSLDQTLPIFLQVCQALSAAHSKGIIHRDLKPANIFLAKDSSSAFTGNLVKIVDFGIAGLATGSLDSQKLTATGSIFGSPLYMSPEQSLGNEVTERSDIYSCGCALFETLTGSPPFRGENVFATMMQHQQRPVPRLNEVSDGRQFPQRLHALIARMLAKQAGDRFQSFGEVSAELQEILIRHDPKLFTIHQDQSAAASADRQGQGDKGPRPPFFRPKMLVACSLVCLAPLGIWMIWSHLRSASITVATKPVDTKPPDTKTADTKQPDTKMTTTESIMPEVNGTKIGPYLQNPQPAKPGWRRFIFPEATSLGNLTWDFEGGATNLSKPLPNHRAQGKVDVPPRTRLQLTATEEPSAKPKLFNGFGADDLDGLTLNSGQLYAWDNTHIKYISKLTGLRYLNINQVQAKDSCIVDLNKLTRLKTLLMRGTPITGAAAAKLNMLPYLEHLEADGTISLFPVLHKMVNSKNIKGLSVVGCRLNDPDMDLIGTMSNLEALNVSTNTEITDRGLQTISKLKRLSRLTIDDTDLTIDCISTLQKMPALRLLKIRWNKWSSKDRTKLVKALPKCQVVTVAGVQEQIIDLGHGYVGPHGTEQ